MIVNARSDLIVKSGVVLAANRNSSEGQPRGRGLGAGSAGLGVGWSCPWGAAVPQGDEDLGSVLSAYLKCEGEPAVFFHVSRGPSYLGGHSRHSDYQGGLAPAFPKMLLMLAILIPLKPLFPEGIGEALIEVGCEEALRKCSPCAAGKLVHISLGNITGSGISRSNARV